MYNKNTKTHETRKMLDDQGSCGRKLKAKLWNLKKP